MGMKFIQNLASYKLLTGKFTLEDWRSMLRGFKRIFTLDMKATLKDDIIITDPLTGKKRYSKKEE